MIRTKVVVFDLDDTLCAYWDASKAALNQAFAENLPNGETPESMISHWATAFRTFSKEVKQSPLYDVYLKMGEPTRTEQMRRAFELAGISDAHLAQRTGDRYAELRDQNLKLFPDAHQVLKQLGAEFRLGLLTNGPADIQRQEVNTLQIGHYFDFIGIEGEVGVGKPARLAFDNALSALGATAEESVFVGNSYSHDILPAIELGWRTAWIIRDSDVPPSQHKFEDKPEGAPEPTKRISALTELIDWLL